MATHGRRVVGGSASEPGAQDEVTEGALAAALCSMVGSLEGEWEEEAAAAAADRPWSRAKGGRNADKGAVAARPARGQQAGPATDSKARDNRAGRRPCHRLHPRRTPPRRAGPT